MRPAYLFMLYLGCYCMVVAYVHTFVLWAWIRKTIGDSADLLPLAAALLITAVAAGLVTRLRRRGVLVQWQWIVGALFCTAVALCLPDPDFPVKRIHVAQYILLALLVRYPLSRRVDGGWLALFTFLVTVLFGIHDELLQGLHPLRTFGLRDIGVNSCAALAGASFGQGINLFAVNCQSRGDRPAPAPGIDEYCLYGVGLLLFSVAMAAMLTPLSEWRKAAIPWWSLGPLLGCLCGAVLFAPEAARRSTLYHGMVVMFWLLIFLPVYPVIANVALVEFN